MFLRIFNLILNELNGIIYTVLLKSNKERNSL
jgi:hypothetical protein